MSNRSGVHMPNFEEPKTLSSKKIRSNITRHYPPPPTPRPILRSISKSTRLIHSRNNDPIDLDKSFATTSQNSNELPFFNQFFEIEERLGFGSFGDVYRVKNIITGIYYAIKKSRKVYTGEADRSRQLREVQRVVNIPQQIHLVELTRAWEENGHLYLQMELCKNSVGQEIEKRVFTEIEIWDILIDTLTALNHLHKNHLVHLDVKPDNIFLSVDHPPVYKLGDFGIVISLEEKRDVTEYTEGDSRYLAPEVMQGIVTTKADIFSLGISLVEISCHVDLPKGGTLWHKLRNGGDLPEGGDEIPSKLYPIIKQMLQPDITIRPSIEQLLKNPYILEHLYRRRRIITKIRIKRFFSSIIEYINYFIIFIWLRLFGGKKNMIGKIIEKKKKNEEGSVAATAAVGASIATKEMTPDSAAMDNLGSRKLMLDNHSFSDDEENTINQRKQVYASTPISNTKPGRRGNINRRGNTSRSNAQLQSQLSTSRNLLKEFEAVSD